MVIHDGDSRSFVFIDSQLARKTICRTGSASGLHRVGRGWLAQCARGLVYTAIEFKDASHAVFLKHRFSASVGFGVEALHLGEFSTHGCANGFLGNVGYLAHDVSDT